MSTEDGGVTFQLTTHSAGDGDVSHYRVGSGICIHGDGANAATWGQGNIATVVTSPPWPRSFNAGTPYNPGTVDNVARLVGSVLQPMLADGAYRDDLVMLCHITNSKNVEAIYGEPTHWYASWLVGDYLKAFEDHGYRALSQAYCGTWKFVDTLHSRRSYEYVMVFGSQQMRRERVDQVITALQEEPCPVYGHGGDRRSAAPYRFAAQKYNVPANGHNIASTAIAGALQRFHMGPGLVVDPFAGSNHVGYIADRQGLPWMSIELSRRAWWLSQWRFLQRHDVSATVRNAKRFGAMEQRILRSMGESTFAELSMYDIIFLASRELYGSDSYGVSSVSTALNHLVEKGLVEKMGQLSDGGNNGPRPTTWSLTDRGWEHIHVRYPYTLAS